MSAQASERAVRGSGTDSGSTGRATATHQTGELTTDLGNTAIADTVVAKVAGIATREMPGVYAMDAGLTRAFGVVRDRIPGVTGTSITQGAAQAVAEVDGAHGMGRRLLGLPMPGTNGTGAPKVTVQIDGQLATVRLSMSVRYPAPIRQVTRRVRDHVMGRVGELTGLQVRHVDVDIPALISPARHGSRVQ